MSYKTLQIILTKRFIAYLHNFLHIAAKYYNQLGRGEACKRNDILNDVSGYIM